MVASTGIAATLLEGGMTAHRKFMLPNNMKHDQLSTVLLAIFIPRNFQRKIILEKKYANSSQMELQHVPAKQLKTAQVIVFDEATMADKNVWNAIDKLLQKIMKNTLPFGGKVMIAGQFQYFLYITKLLFQAAIGNSFCQWFQERATMLQSIILFSLFHYGNTSRYAEHRVIHI